MLSKLVSISQEEDLQEVTELTEKQLQLLFFLLFSPDYEYSFLELKRKIYDELSLSFSDRTLSRSLEKLEERQLVTWERAKKLRYDKRSKIKLNGLDMEKKLGIQKQVEKVYSEFEKVKEEAQDMNEEDICFELIEIAKKQAGASLYLKLLEAQGVFDEEQASIGYYLNYVFSEITQNLYLDIIIERGTKSVIEVTHYFLNSGTENKS